MCPHRTSPPCPGTPLRGVPGRFVIDARANHLVTDSRFGLVSPSRPGELLLSALASCAMANVEANAQELDCRSPGFASRHRTPVEVRTRPGTTSHGSRSPQAGVDQAAADVLRDRFVSTCPIYNTIRRGGGIELTVLAS